MGVHLCLRLALGLNIAAATLDAQDVLDIGHAELLTIWHAS